MKKDVEVTVKGNKINVKSNKDSNISKDGSVRALTPYNRFTAQYESAETYTKLNSLLAIIDTSIEQYDDLYVVYTTQKVNAIPCIQVVVINPKFSKHHSNEHRELYLDPLDELGVHVTRNVPNNSSTYTFAI